VVNFVTKNQAKLIKRRKILVLFPKVLMQLKILVIKRNKNVIWHPIHQTICLDSRSSKIKASRYCQ